MTFSFTRQAGESPHCPQPGLDGVASGLRTMVASDDLEADCMGAIADQDPRSAIAL
jgi:hypothetical protein